MMNNIELEELARRAVASKHWRWMLGMQLSDGRRVVGWTEDGRELLFCSNKQVGCFGLLSESECVPDLSDPATIGCLLALVREAWKNPHAYVDYSNKWKAAFCCDVGLRAFSSTTEAAALVAALEAAPFTSI